MKQPVEIERLLHWAYREELPKKQLSSAGNWGRIEAIGRGGIDPGHGSAQRYPHFGVPHPDAGRIEGAVASLEDAVIDWEQDADLILGELVALVEPRVPGIDDGLDPPGSGSDAGQRRSPRAGWAERGRWRIDVLDPADHSRRQNQPIATGVEPRQVILVRSLRTNALVVMHAKMGTRPDWREAVPRPSYIQAAHSATGTPKIVGECWGSDRYSTGSYCPLCWFPSPTTVAEARVDYLAWWRGLRQLAASLELGDHQALPPAAPEMPWRDPEAPTTVRTELWPRKLTPLPLKPARKLAGAPERHKRAETGRRVGP